VDGFLFGLGRSNEYVRREVFQDRAGVFDVHEDRFPRYEAFFQEHSLWEEVLIDETERLDISDKGLEPLQLGLSRSVLSEILTVDVSTGMFGSFSPLALFILAHRVPERHLALFFVVVCRHAFQKSVHGFLFVVVCRHTRLRSL
jgi:hypothetical protein